MRIGKKRFEVKEVEALKSRRLHPKVDTGSLARHIIKPSWRVSGSSCFFLFPSFLPLFLTLFFTLLLASFILFCLLSSSSLFYSPSSSFFLAHFFSKFFFSSGFAVPNLMGEELPRCPKHFRRGYKRLSLVEREERQESLCEEVKERRSGDSLKQPPPLVGRSAAPFKSDRHPVPDGPPNTEGYRRPFRWDLFPVHASTATFTLQIFVYIL